MKRLFIIAGMGAGKSTARKALVEQGLPNIDLDQVGHDVLLWDTVKSELVETFGEDILGSDGEIDRRGAHLTLDVQEMVRALERGDLAAVCALVGNVFEQVLPPGSEIFAIRDRLLALGAGTACMSGSGSAVVGFFSQEEAARSSAAAMTEVPFVRCVGRG